MSAICSFAPTLYLKQQTNILRCFSGLKFEKSLFSNKLFRCIFRSERKVYTAKITFIFVKITLIFAQSTFWLCYHCHKLRFFQFVESFEGLFHHSGNCMFFICIRLSTTTTSDWTHTLNIRKREPYKNFKIFFNMESYKGWRLEQTSENV